MSEGIVNGFSDLLKGVSGNILGNGFFIEGAENGPFTNEIEIYNGAWDIAGPGSVLRLPNGGPEEVACVVIDSPVSATAVTTLSQAVVDGNAAIAKATGFSFAIDVFVDRQAKAVNFEQRTDGTDPYSATLRIGNQTFVLSSKQISPLQWKRFVIHTDEIGDTLTVALDVMPGAKLRFAYGVVLAGRFTHVPRIVPTSTTILMSKALKSLTNANSLAGLNINLNGMAEGTFMKVHNGEIIFVPEPKGVLGLEINDVRLDDATMVEESEMWLLEKAVRFLFTGTGTVYFSFQVPDEWSRSLPINLTLGVSPTTNPQSTDNVLLKFAYWVVAEGQIPDVNTPNANYSETISLNGMTGNANHFRQLVTAKIQGADLAPGKCRVLCRLSRDPATAQDTYNANLDLISVFVKTAV